MKLTPSVFYSPHKGSYAVFVLNIYSSVCTYDCTVDRTALLYIFTKCIYLAGDILVLFWMEMKNLTVNEKCVPF